MGSPSRPRIRPRGKRAPACALSVDGPHTNVSGISARGEQLLVELDELGRLPGRQLARLLGRPVVEARRLRALDGLLQPRERRLAWHATRVVPGGFLSSAVNRLRASGTLPPAAGVMPVSGAGSGQ